MQIQFATPEHLTAIEQQLVDAGFVGYRLGSTGNYAFRRFFELKEFQGVFKALLRRHGASERQQISIVYNCSQDLISVCVMEADALLEYPLSQAESILWHAGVTIGEKAA